MKSVDIKYKPLYSKWVDLVFILMPPFWCLAIIAFLPDTYLYSSELPLAAWVILVMCIDVAHVYSTLYRTYFSTETYKQHHQIFKLIPFICLLFSFITYSYSAYWFWRIFAYIAVFHFVRQQYGFMRLYTISDDQTTPERRVDTITIYAATLYPMLHWHFTGNRNFSWFTSNDFFSFHFPVVMPWLGFIYLAILVLYVFTQFSFWWRTDIINLPKQLVVLGTALSWYIGIVHYNDDLVFTLLNVVTHGIPYMALVWIWGRKSTQYSPNNKNRLNKVFSPKGIILFVVSLIALAYLEELLWDAFVWHEHQSVFSWFKSGYNQLDDFWLKLLVPLLSLPQLVHYVIDGFIWKIKKDNFRWANQVLDK
jgi:hypothetical protein